jgi:UDP-N-acetylmuramoyl-tripeptide--D-alanyl-D-alanine ligase
MNPLFLTHLHILQLEEYAPSRFLRWWIRHPLVFRSTQKKPLVWTRKAQLLRLLSILISVLLISGSYWTFSWLGALLMVTLLALTPLSLLLSISFLLPLESWKRKQLIESSTRSLQKNSGLQTIGITGSYGTTSVKEMLYHILSRSEITVRTPESYNTPLGIARTIHMEITSKVQYFLCEMGAYQRGDISALTRQVPLDFAILTAVGRQHLERFGSLENTTKGKFEIIDAVQPEHALVNLDNEYIRQHLEKNPQYKNVKTYSLDNPQAYFYASHLRFSAEGVKWQLNSPRKKILLSSPLFGTANLQNLIAATAMAVMLKVPDKTIQEALRNIAPAEHRLELKKIGKATLIDNAFSSNDAGFHLVMLDLEQLDGKKVLITPGIIELGKETEPVHYHLGEQAAKVFDTIYLVGKSERTTSFFQGIKSIRPDLSVVFLENSENLWPLIHELSEKYDWILLENDLPDNY